MPKGPKKDAPDELKGWEEIAAFLGQPVSVAERWAESGMPIEKRGRFVYSSREQLNRWLGRQSAGGPVHIATENADLSSELTWTLVRSKTGWNGSYERESGVDIGIVRFPG